jgi:eukaryotic-like serine/threonine-protein kinase
MKSGDTIGKYRLVSRIGRGGMGEVWLASASGHGGFTKSVVLKTVLPELASDPMFVDMLAHEARICARLSHPNLVEVFDFTVHDGIYLLAMEHVVGRPITHIMGKAQERGWPIPPWFALRVAWECCRGLACAHDQGIIHCDLSASNVMVSFSGVTKILDFGVAHSSEQGSKADRLKGKFAYMAPERIRSLATDRRTDIYSLGVMLYLMFTGRLPFVGETDAQLMWKIVREAPKPPSTYCTIDPVIEQVIIRAIQPDPAARQQNVAEMVTAIAKCLEGHGSYGQDDAATFVTGLFGTSDTARHVRPRAAGDDQASSIELSFSDLEESSLAVWSELPSPSFSLPDPVPAASFVEPHTSWSIARSPRPTTVVFSDPPLARASVPNLFVERPTMSGGHTNIFTRPVERHAALDDDPVPEWPWPSSRQKSQ